ncbi:hypothetical protein [Melissospora conviva]|uniref:hypothetical protein n=1 Tax=Melissospora conviva TaxID=3388432 RepID=UPI003C24033D
MIDLLERTTVATTTAWVGRVDYDLAPDTDDTQLAGVPNATVTDGQLVLVLHAEATTIKQAADDILRAARDTLQTAGLRMQPAGLHIQPRDDLDRGVIRPPLPALVGYAEIAKILGVSRQRARVVAERPDFPAIASQTKSGPLYSRDQVEVFAQRRQASTERKPTSN